MPEISPLIMKMNTNAPICVFALQARATDDDVDGQELSLAQVETARNAAVAVLNTIGIDVDSTSSVLNVPAQAEPSRLVLTPSVETLAEIAQASADAQAQAEADAAALEAARAQARSDAETFVIEEPIEDEPTEIEVIDEPIEE